MQHMDHDILDLLIERLPIDPTARTSRRARSSRPKDALSVMAAALALTLAALWLLSRAAGAQPLGPVAPIGASPNGELPPAGPAAAPPPTPPAPPAPPVESRTPSPLLAVRSPEIQVMVLGGIVTTYSQPVVYDGYVGARSKQVFADRFILELQVRLDRDTLPSTASTRSSWSC